MAGEKKNIRSAVYRHKAQSYLLISLISFAGTVVLTRLFLELTGYPQLGGGQLHIAHVLWGGLILFIAALLPLLLGNRWVLEISAILSGVGIGLFIDEVGKFITRDNDYFFPPAAPIIYAVFLLTVMLYLRIRRSREQNSRQQLYQVLEGLTEVLDHDLEPDEREDLIRQLESIEDDAHNPNLSILAKTLLNYIQSETLQVQDSRWTLYDRIRQTMSRLDKAVFTRRRMRIVLIAALLFVGVIAWYELAIIAPSFFNQGKFIETALLTGLQRGEVRSAVGAIWFFIHLGMQGIVGLLAFSSTALLASRREKIALDLASACLILSLTAVNLLAFFVNQFSASSIALFQLAVLVSLTTYRRRFLPETN